MFSFEELLNTQNKCILVFPSASFSQKQDLLQNISISIIIQKKLSVEVGGFELTQKKVVVENIFLQLLSLLYRRAFGSFIIPLRVHHDEKIPFEAIAFKEMVEEKLF